MMLRSRTVRIVFLAVAVLCTSPRPARAGDPAAGLLCRTPVQLEVDGFSVKLKYKSGKKGDARGSSLEPGTCTRVTRSLGSILDVNVTSDGLYVVSLMTDPGSLATERAIKLWRDKLAKQQELLDKLKSAERKAERTNIGVSQSALQMMEATRSDKLVDLYATDESNRMVAKRQLLIQLLSQKDAVVRFDGGDKYETWGWVPPPVTNAKPSSATNAGGGAAAPPPQN